MTQPAETVPRWADEDPDGGYIVFLDEPVEVTADDFYRIYGPGPPVTDEGEIVDELTAAGEPHDGGGMVALIPSSEDLSRLALENGMPIDQLHLTLQYFANADEIDGETRDRLLVSMDDAARHQLRISGHAFSVNVFNPLGDEPCIVIGVGGDELAAFHEYIEGAVGDSGIDTSDAKRPWVPHITLAYIDNDVLSPFSIDVNDIAAQRMGEIVFDTLRVAFGDEVHDFSLV